MSQDSPLSVAAALTVAPLDRGSVVAGHRGLTREVTWVDIIHAPAESFIRPGDLVLCTGADIRQPGNREFLAYLVSSHAAGLILSPPPRSPSANSSARWFRSPIVMSSRWYFCHGRSPSPMFRNACSHC